MFIYHWIWTRTHNIIRYTTFGQVTYTISYRRTTDKHRLLHINITTKNMGNYDYDVYEKLEYDDKSELLTSAKKIADDYIFYQIKHNSLMEVKFFDNKVEYLKFLSE